MNPVLIEATDSNFSGPMTIPETLFAEGKPTADVWLTASMTQASNVRTGIWVGQPGKVNVPAYPTDEVFTVTSGRIELTSPDGTKIAIGPGQSCLIAKGWIGLWHTVETTTKCYVTFEASAD